MAKIKDESITRVTGCKYMGICTRCNFEFYFNMSRQNLKRSVIMCPLCKIGEVNIYEIK